MVAAGPSPLLRHLPGDTSGSALGARTPGTGRWPGSSRVKEIRVLAPPNVPGCCGGGAEIRARFPSRARAGGGGYRGPSWTRGLQMKLLAPHPAAHKGGFELCPGGCLPNPSPQHHGVGSAALAQQPGGNACQQGGEISWGSVTGRGLIITALTQKPQEGKSCFDPRPPVSGPAIGAQQRSHMATPRCRARKTHACFLGAHSPWGADRDPCTKAGGARAMQTSAPPPRGNLGAPCPLEPAGWSDTGADPLQAPQSLG